MIKYFLAIFFCFLLQNIQAQITWDTTREMSRHEAGYGTFKPSVKVGIFYNGNYGVEIGRVKQNLSLVAYMSTTTTRYYALTYTAIENYKSGLFGLKYSSDINFRYLYIGVGAQVQTDFNQLKFSFLPAVGLFRYGTVGLYYTRPILLSNQNFLGNNKNQFSLSYNFTKQLSKEFKAGVKY
jgi:hypothetical protein